MTSPTAPIPEPIGVGSSLALWLDRLPAEIERYKSLPDGFARNRARALLMRGLDTHHPHSARAEYRAAAQAVQRALGLDEDRFRILMKIPSRELVARALKYEGKARTRHQRFPEDAIYPTTGWFGEYLDAHIGMEVPLAWHFWSAVGAFGGALRRNFFLDRGSYFLWPNQFVFLVGPTGAHKSTAISCTRDVIKLMNMHLDEWGERQDPPEDKALTFHYGSGSVQGLLDMLAVKEINLTAKDGVIAPRVKPDSSGLLVNDEAINIIGKSQLGSGEWIDKLLFLWGCPDRFEENFRTRKGRVYENVALSVIFGSTSDQLGRGTQPSMFHGGFMGRFVFVERETSGRVKSKPEPVDPVRVYKLAEQLAAVSRVPLGEEMALTDTAERYFDAYYAYHSQMKPDTSLMVGYHNRKMDLLLKLAVVMSLSDDPERREIEVVQLETARKILEHEERRLSDTFTKLVRLSDDNPSFTLAQETKAYHALSDYGGAWTKQEWVRASGLSARDFELAHLGLVERGLVAMRKIDTGGRPRVIYYVKPSGLGRAIEATPGVDEALAALSLPRGGQTAKPKVTS